MAARRDEGPSFPPGTLPRETLEILWDRGRSSIRDVVDGMDSKLGSGVPYSTVASVLNKLCKAGFTTRSRILGTRKYLYSALVSREQLEKTSTMEAVQTVFEKSRNQREALSYLVGIVGEAGRQLLDDLRNLVEQRRREAKPKREP
jgi:predicted transcriptional regulator